MAENKKQEKSKLQITADVVETALSPFVLYDTIKNSALSAVASGDVKKLQAIKKSLKGSDIPKSIMDNAVEGIDVVMDANPKFAAENPSLAAAAGIAIDLLDPVGNVARIAKAPAPIFKFAQQMGKSLKVKGTEKFVKKNIDKKDMDKVGKLLETIDKQNLYKDLSNPEKLSKKLEKSSAIKGAELQSFVEGISAKAPEINRTDILNKMVEARKAKNISETQTGVRDIGKYRATMSPLLKAEKMITETIPPVSPKSAAELTPPIPTQGLSKKVRKLEQEKAEFVKAEEARKAQKPKIGLLAGQEPPAIPTEATKRPLEDIMAELAQSRQSLESAAKTNVGIEKEIAESLPTIKESVEPVITDVNDLWKLKKDIRKQIPETKRGVPLDNVQEQKAKDAREALYAIDESIAESLSQVNLPDGSNAADVFKSLNQDFSKEQELLKFLQNPTLKEWRKTSNVIPTVAGIGTAAGASMLGLPAGPALATGLAIGGAARSARQGLSMPVVQAGRALESAPGATAVTQIPSEVGTGFFKGEEQAPEIEEVQEPASMEDYDFSAMDKSTQAPAMPEPTPEIPMEMPQQQMPMPEPQADNYVSYADQILNAQPLQLNPYLSDMVLNTPLPRDSKRILANPDVLRAKMGQAAPQHLPMLEDMLRNDPELLADGLAKIAGLVPSLFETDKYGSFDGMIKNPDMQQKFLNDLRADEGLSSIDKANMSMKVFRGQRVI